MAESSIEPEMESSNDAAILVATPVKDTDELAITTGQLKQLTAPIIWTPRFIITFALTLVIGLSGACLLTPVATSGRITAGWLLLAYIVVLFVGWLVLVRAVNSPWIRMGGIFGCIWAVFAAISYAMSALPVDPKSANVVHLHAATATALFGCYICLSVNQTLFHRWDGWFFRLVSIVGACAVAITYFLLPTAMRSSLTLEGVTAAVMFFLCLFVWWLRPSCWRGMPGATFLFGTTPLILLVLAIPNITNSTNMFFFSQVALLALLLGIMRIFQGERV